MLLAVYKIKSLIIKLSHLLVAFGYGDRTEMEECHAAYIAESVNELRKMLVS